MKNASDFIILRLFISHSRSRLFFEGEKKVECESTRSYRREFPRNKKKALCVYTKSMSGTEAGAERRTAYETILWDEVEGHNAPQ